MNPAQRRHVNRLVRQFASEGTAKYRAGVKEHRKQLWDIPVEDLVEMLLDEVLDLWMYGATIRDLLRPRRRKALPRQRL